MTLLFADVEGSTRLLHALGERFAPARARMREIVHGGHLQRRPRGRLGRRRRLPLVRRRARVDSGGRRDAALLTTSRGRPTRRCDSDRNPHRRARARRRGYVGMDVVVASRICAAAHGEQVVITRATRNLVGDASLMGASYRPLGQHRLKDVPDTQQLFQLLAPGLRQSFSTSDADRDQPPGPPPPARGSSRSARTHRGASREPDVRLVTITGPGGAGKAVLLSRSPRRPRWSGPSISWGWRRSRTGISSRTPSPER